MFKGQRKEKNTTEQGRFLKGLDYIYCITILVYL